MTPIELLQIWQIRDGEEISCGLADPSIEGQVHFQFETDCKSMKSLLNEEPNKKESSLKALQSETKIQVSFS